MRRSLRLQGRILTRYTLYATVWTAVVALSWFTYRRGLALGGTAAWAGILHPVLFALTAWPVLRSFVRGERWLTIPNAVLALTYLAMGLGSVHFVFHYASLPYAPLRRPEEVRAALLLVVLGVVTYRIGAEGFRFHTLSRSLPGLPGTPRWSWGVRAGAFMAIGLAVAVKLYLAATGSLGFRTGTGGIAGTGLGSILGYLSWVGVLALAGVYFYWFSGVSLSRLDRLFVITATVMLAGLGLLSGMKSEFLVVFFGVAIPYLWTRRPGQRTQGKEFLFGLGVVVLLILVFALNPMYRSALQQLQGIEDRTQQAPAATALVLEEVRSGGYGLAPLVATGTERAWERLSIFPYHLAVVDQVPESQAFRGFDRYVQLPAMALVPRAIWPDKPANTITADFQRRFISAHVVFSTTPTVYGWAYWELGAAGMAIIMLLLGVVAGVVETYLAERQRGQVGAVLFYTALFVTLADIEADPFWLLGGLPKMIVTSMVVYVLFVSPGMLGGRKGVGVQRQFVSPANEESE